MDDKIVSEKEYIEVFGARVHNLKNIDVSIPRNQLCVVTGLSGSGKSSLAFDTLFAEGQRRYIETFSSYARGFLGSMERPDVDKISGLSPVISIDQKTTNKNPRSTVGTITEIYDFFRLLYARAGEAYSYMTGEKMVKYTQEQIFSMIMDRYMDQAVYIMSPLVKGRKGHYKELFENLLKKGYLTVRIDGKLQEIVPMMKLNRYQNHDVELVVDKLIISPHEEHRIKSSLAFAIKQGNGIVMVMDKESEQIRYFSRNLMCPTSGIAYQDPAPHNFSFNSPKGACPYCKGLGVVEEIDRSKVFRMSLSIAKGGIIPLGTNKNSKIYLALEALALKRGFSLNDPLSSLSPEDIDEILYGCPEPLLLTYEVLGGTSFAYHFEGIASMIDQIQEQDAPASLTRWANSFISSKTCPQCLGQRLNKEALNFLLAGQNIAQISLLDMDDLQKWVDDLPRHLDERQRLIAFEICKEIHSRIGFLLDVGLDYLSLNRSTYTLSGGESQRIRLATQVGSQLVNVLYILDEPSIGLHQRDNRKLIASLKKLRDEGNSVLVVEHDEEMMLSCDYLIEIGPGAGRLGGELIFQGPPADLLKKETLLSSYLTGKKKVELPIIPRKKSTKVLSLKGAKGNNLKNIDVDFPLGSLIVVTGVSGSGKSSLINHTLQPILSRKFYGSLKEPLPYKSIKGLDLVNKVITVDQSPLGRTPRSNPATYTGVFSDIRSLFVALPEAKIRGYKAGRFSFNVKGGRCENCQGNGHKALEMNFLPDVYVLCETCHGKRYNRETLEVRYKGKSISDVLDMSIDEAVEFFASHPTIFSKIRTLQEVGLGYIKLGQSCTTLSGGESQRVKLATELSKKDTGQTVYILDEPTTGLHFEDINVLLKVIARLVNKGNTAIVIEHNLDVIRVADHIIDIGPEGGKGGGKVVAVGTPDQLIQKGIGYTAQYLKEKK